MVKNLSTGVGWAALKEDVDALLKSRALKKSHQILCDLDVAEYETMVKSLSGRHFISVTPKIKQDNYIEMCNNLSNRDWIKT